MRSSFRVLLLAVMVAVGGARPSEAQWAVVRSNVNLRQDPSTANPAVRLLAPGTELELIEPDRVNRYYLVLTAAGEIGWVYGNNIRLLADGEEAALEHFPRERGPMPAYDRDRHFGGWVDEDGDCQDTRAEVLARDSESSVTTNPAGCRVRAGRWKDPYGGGVLTVAGDVDIDHVVPLKNAHGSGAWRWSYARRRAYANHLRDPNHLLAADDGLNQAKGDKGPDRWLPPLQAYLCTYVLEWERIKERWRLTIFPAERAAVDSIEAAHCP